MPCHFGVWPVAGPCGRESGTDETAPANIRPQDILDLVVLEVL